MALDLATFRARFPELSRASDTLVQAKLDDAAVQISEEVYGAKANAAHGFLAAHLLSTSPHGQQARLAADGSDTTYWRSYRAIAIQVGVGCRVL